MARMAGRRTLTLLAIGTAAGLFSGLFGVGGGVLIVPLLVLWCGFGERLATGTSLAAIVIIAAVATAAHGAYGNVHLREGLLVGVPAVAGVLLGTELQQRISARAISLVFAALLTAVAVELLVGLMIEAVAHRPGGGGRRRAARGRRRRAVRAGADARVWG